MCLSPSDLPTIYQDSFCLPQESVRTSPGRNKVVGRECHLGGVKIAVQGAGYRPPAVRAVPPAALALLSVLPVRSAVVVHNQILHNYFRIGDHFAGCIIISTNYDSMGRANMKMNFCNLGGWPLLLHQPILDLSELLLLE